MRETFLLACFSLFSVRSKLSSLLQKKYRRREEHQNATKIPAPKDLGRRPLSVGAPVREQRARTAPRRPSHQQSAVITTDGSMQLAMLLTLTSLPPPQPFPATLVIRPRSIVEPLQCNKKKKLLIYKSLFIPGSCLKSLFLSHHIIFLPDSVLVIILFAKWIQSCQSCSSSTDYLFPRSAWSCCSPEREEEEGNLSN